jgi:hypothetical protein
MQDGEEAAASEGVCCSANLSYLDKRLRETAEPFLFARGFSLAQD